MIEIQNLCKRFGPLTAVDNVSFSVQRGEVLGFLGPNGAGKSTTMKMITGFLNATSGRVGVCGKDVTKDPLAVKKSIGYLPEGAPLYPDMTAKTFLGFIAEIRGLSGRQKDDRIAEVARLVHLEGVMNQRLETLSKGFKRRVGLAQAILHDPEVLILDEPTDGLDPNQKHEVRSLIKSMAKDKVIVLSTHILEEVEAVCSRAIIIARGKVLFDGTPAELAGRSTYHNAVSVVLHGSEVQNEQLAKLEGISGVQKVESDSSNGHVRLRIVPDQGAEILDDVRSLASTESLDVDQIFLEHGRLDEVFREITTSGQAN